MKPTTLLLTLLASSGLAIATSTFDAAYAFTLILDANRSVSSNTSATGASAEVEFDFVDVSNSLIQLNLRLENTTSTTITSKFTGFAFDLLPRVLFLGSTLESGSSFDAFLTQVNFQPFSNRSDVGIFNIGIADDRNFEGGNANDALAQGQQDTFSLQLSNFTPGTTADQLEALFSAGFLDGSLDFAARFQQVGPNQQGSDKLLGGEVINPDDNGVPVSVPEPSAMAGIALIGGALAALRRWKANRSN